MCQAGEAHKQDQLQYSDATPSVEIVPVAGLETD